ncbi:hypothetical protein [Aurantibacillus circumpalustris]|uniref:hypothetical protein n=1 Tax=Aurantibacillus circumpalustris TaxID=3036359 RepID=UPI00295C38F5|nr:hypothetical protein [Aurantibacillus circumpalustris]
MGLEDLRERLNFVRSLPLETTSISDIQKLIGEVILGHSRTLYYLDLEMLMRARKNRGKKTFRNIKSLGCPNWKSIDPKNWVYCRCNDKGEKMFYAAGETDTSIIETKPKKGEHITLTMFKSKNETSRASVQVIGGTKLRLNDQRFGKIIKEDVNNYNNLDKELKAKNELVNNFLEEQFMLDVPKSESWKYKISIAITKILLTGEGIHGLVFPSIAMKHKGVNLILKPEFTDNHFQIAGRSVVEIKEVTTQYIDVKHVFSPLNKKNKAPEIIKWRLPYPEENEEYRIEI